MIIKSLLDQDLYKLFMAQVVFHKYTSVNARYDYKLRNTESIQLDSNFISRLKVELNQLCALRFKESELVYLKETGYFKDDFLEYLRLFSLNINHVHLDEDSLKIHFEGPWLNIKMFEIFTMEIISELYFKKYKTEELFSNGRERLKKDIIYLKNYNRLNKNNSFKFADFGSRRRFSTEWHDHVLNVLLVNVPKNVIGTSNIYLAKKYNIKPIGTMAHEYLQAFQALGPRLIDSQKVALQTWADEYRGKLGIALTDVITMDAFLKDFDLYFCKLFDGCRHDSGDPVVWCEKLINHYEKMGIDPRTKTAVFSDGLTIPKAISLFDMFHDKIKVSFGIGTSLTNNLGIPALNHVIKMTECNGQPVAKISDSKGKTMCKDESYVEYLKKTFGVK